MLRIRYEPEPLPITTRGALNPWQVARERALRLAEDEAWTKIQTLQGDYRRVKANLKRMVDAYNLKVHQLEERVGDVPGIDALVSTGLSYMKYVFPLWFGVDQMIGKALSLIGIGRGPSAGDIEQAKMLIEQMQVLGVHIQRAQVTLGQTITALRGLTQQATRLKSLQASIQREDVMESEAAHARKRLAERSAAAVTQAKAARVALLYPHWRASDAL